MGLALRPLSKQAVVDRVRELPPLPQALAALCRSLGDDTAGADRLARDIALDPALAARTLRLANSSMYGLSRQVGSLGDAVAVLGVRTLRTMATVAGIVANFTPGQCAGFDFVAFWRHSVATALAARAVAQLRALDDTAAFTLGLLHDIGRLALATYFPVPMARALAHQFATDTPSLDAERAVLGIDHAVVGALLAEHWRFVPDWVVVIGAHHEPPESAHATLADVVHVADRLAHALDLSGVERDAVPALSMPAWARLGLDQRDCRAVLDRVESEHASVCAALLAH